MSKNITVSLTGLQKAISAGLQCINSGNYEEGNRLLKKAIRKLEVVPKYKNDREARLLLSLAYTYQSLPATIKMTERRRYF